MGALLVEEDDFSGSNADPPDPTKWTKHANSNEVVEIRNNALRVKSVSGWPGAVSVDDYDTTRITMLVDWKASNTQGNMLSFGLLTDAHDTRAHRAFISYDAYWGWTVTFSNNNVKTQAPSWIRNVNVGTWYSINITVWDDNINFTVKETSTGRHTWSKNNQPTDMLLHDNIIFLEDGEGGECYYDNYRLYDLDKPPNSPPVWGSIPNIQAIEDIPLTYDFSSHISDPDGPFGDLSINASSTYITGYSGHKFTFLFPEGVTSHTIPFTLSDGWDQVETYVDFTIEPVNDPPEHEIPVDHLATEDVMYHVDLSAKVWDVDSPVEYLDLVVSDPYVTVNGLMMSALFPEGILSYNVTIDLTDGFLTVNVDIVFTINPVDDPPTIQPLGEFTALEDSKSVFDVAPYLDDIDTPVDDLSLIVRDYNCTVVGQELHFMYTVGGMTETVLVQVTDGRSLVDAELMVHVEERNDAPVLLPIGPQNFEEDTPVTVDLSSFVTDEDDPLSAMVVTCDSPCLIEITGLNMTFLYTKWMTDHDVYFDVSDGFHVTQGQFLAQVQAVNDPPRVHSVGGLLPPIAIEVDEGTTMQFDVIVVDEDDHNFRYTITSLWPGVSVDPYGQVVVVAAHGDVGQYEATLSVLDPSKASDSLKLTIAVRNVNDPPTLPVVKKPVNHTIVVAGENVTFSVSVTDPDTEWGQVLTVTWISNVSGMIMSLTTEEDLSFMVDDLPVGTHRISVKVTDGEFVQEVWFDLQVVEPYVPPPKEEEPFYSTGAGIGLVILVLLGVVGSAIMLLMRSRRSPDKRGKPTARDGAIVTEIVEGSQRYEMEAEAIEEEGALVSPSDIALAAVSSQVREDASHEVLDLEMAAELTPEELASRKHSNEVQQVMRSLTQLPHGIPTVLWGKDLSLLAKEVVDGPRREGPDGTQLVEIDGLWYNADHTNIPTFLREHKEQADDEAPGEAPEELSDALREKKLEKLENALLEGNITEEMYQRLVKKYEEP